MRFVDLRRYFTRRTEPEPSRGIDCPCGTDLTDGESLSFHHKGSLRFLCIDCGASTWWRETRKQWEMIMIDGNRL